jgi:geranylgeranyl diphosphate synthase type II
MKNIINDALKKYVLSINNPSLRDAIKYSLLAGGKRIRPILFLEVIKSYGLNHLDYIDIAISLELIHTYSLIHDDLPSMDNDSIRRGKPTLHIAYGESTAILAGDALLTDSFRLISSSLLLDSNIKTKLIEVLSEKTGSNGMIMGQMLDLASEGVELPLFDLDQMYEKKTSNLIVASLVMGAIVSGEKNTQLWSNLGFILGLLFQIQDDVLEETLSVDIIGKTKSDTIRKKPTYVSILGLNETKIHILKLENEITKIINKLKLFDSSLYQLILKIINRSN